ncbi:ExeA family protein [Alicyclobacillus acidoterrestris]|uniref:AAA family ATPase n=4 Tax=Alicyclobacillus TaxID=29330 RepID=A0A9E6ZHG3_ALIAG|nr:AAA family ATPase [Alicyclobacillus acidoterrestris]UNO50847.1 AAA family ATPase [Alicyclobacillus acidoterrestris]UNO50972.1 AAA family ATPase [Alicyclobacillus acidoterrestris]
MEKWNWSNEPFRRDVTVDGLFETGGHKEAMARLHYVLEHKSLGLLTGEVGSGKTTLIRRLLTGLDEMKFLPVYICVLGLKPKDFYAELLSYMGEAMPFGLSKARKLWHERIQGQAGMERGWVVVIDEAQDMSEEMIQELRFVRNQQMDASSPFPLLLVGQPEMRRKLRLKKYEAISQRIEMAYHLSGMTREESTEYIRHQMKQTGGNLPVFTDAAMQMIHAASKGIPRVVNQMCTQALYDAAAKNSEAIDESHVGRVLTDQEWQRGSAG